MSPFKLKLVKTDERGVGVLITMTFKPEAGRSLVTQAIIKSNELNLKDLRRIKDSMKTALLRFHMENNV